MGEDIVSADETCVHSLSVSDEEWIIRKRGISTNGLDQIRPFPF